MGNYNSEIQSNIACQSLTSACLVPWEGILMGYGDLAQPPELSFFFFYQGQNLQLSGLLNLVLVHSGLKLQNSLILVLRIDYLLESQ